MTLFAELSNLLVRRDGCKKKACHMHEHSAAAFRPWQSAARGKRRIRCKLTHMPIGSDPCSTITGAGIMKMSSMSPYGVEGRTYIFVIMNAYVERAEQVHGESDIFFF